MMLIFNKEECNVEKRWPALSVTKAFSLVKRFLINIKYYRFIYDRIIREVPLD